MQNLQDIVMQLKHLVGKLNQLASDGFKAKEQRIDGPDSVEAISSIRPVATIVKQASSFVSEPDSVSVLC